MTLPLISLMGGTFNPIHLGHLHMASALCEAMQFAELRFIPSSLPPHRDEPETSALHRAAMVRLAIAEEPQFRLDSRELTRDGFSYTIDTLISLRTDFGDEIGLCWLLGSDAFMGLCTWHRWQELLDYCHLVVVQRPQSRINQAQLDVPLATLLKAHGCADKVELKAQSHGLIYIEEVQALDISSTQIREHLKLKDGKASEMLPESVMEYIERYGLYAGNTEVLSN